MLRVGVILLSMVTPAWLLAQEEVFECSNASANLHLKVMKTTKTEVTISFENIIKSEVFFEQQAKESFANSNFLVNIKDKQHFFITTSTESGLGGTTEITRTRFIATINIKRIDNKPMIESTTCSEATDSISEEVICRHDVYKRSY